MNIYDLIVFDLIIFCHSQKLMIPGTEDMIKEYRSPWHHIKGAIKGIVIGAGGSMLKQVGMQARSDIERLLGSKVNLTLWVKVKKDWRDTDTLLRNFGFRDE